MVTFSLSIVWIAAFSYVMVWMVGNFITLTITIAYNKEVTTLCAFCVGCCYWVYLGHT